MASPRIDRIEAANQLIINGNLDFFQRNTTSSVSNAAVTFVADRFSFRPGAANGTGTMARDTLVPTFGQSGFNSTYSLKMTAPASGGAASSNTTVSIGYALEGYDYATIHASSARLQFWVRSSVTGTYTICFRNSDASRMYLATYSISAANTWEKKTIDITLDTLSSPTWAFDNSLGMRIEWMMQAGSSRTSGTVGSWTTRAADGQPLGATGQADMWGTTNATFNIAQVMLVPGSFSSSTDLKFKRAGKNMAEELQKCHRYCYVIGDSGGQRTIGYGHVYSATTIVLQMQTPAPMRGVPTLTVVTASGNWIQSYVGSASQSVGTTPAASAEIAGNGMENRFDTSVGGFSGLTAGGSTWTITSGAGALLIISAEL